jgi:hypothetical protein
MSTKIDFNMLPTQKIFEMWFRVPNYQRPYVWGKDQVLDLLDDISTAYQQDKENQYFLGSLVLRENVNKNQEYKEYDVLDGQQRLTTLFLITAVIRDLTTNIQRQDTCQKSIYQLANPDDNIPERPRIIFEIREEVKEFINNYIKVVGGTNHTDVAKKAEDSKVDISIFNMANAVIIIKNYFEENNNIDEFFPFFRNKVNLLYVSTENLDDAFKLFTILNNRGVKLRSADILKADNLNEVSVEKQNTYAKKWEEDEKYFGEEFDVFLSHLQSILVQDKARLSLLDEFERNIFKKNLLSKGENFFNFVHNYKNHYQALFDEMEDKEIKNLLVLMEAGFESNGWVAPLLKYYDKFREKDLLLFIKKLNNKFASDWISSLTPTTRINNMNEIIKQINKSENTENLFQSNVFSINSNEILTFLEGNIYGKRTARYILLRLNYLYLSSQTDFSLPKTISIEHILPQNPQQGSQWLEDFTSEEHDLWKNKLGNLIIISRKKNSSQSNLNFEDKKARYFEKNVELGRSAFIMSKNTWQLDDLQQNHKDAVAKLKESFDIR